MGKRLLTKEESTNLAILIEAMKPMIWAIDLDYLSAVSKGLFEKASMYDAGAVFVRSYTPARSAWILEQAKAARLLKEYIESLKKCDELKKNVQDIEAKQVEIENIFK